MTEELSLFPLNAVLLPGGLLPLRIFETRYLDMVRNCLREDKGFGICLIRSGQEVGRAAEIHHIGTRVHVVDWEQKADGLLGIWVQGDMKFNVLKTEVCADQLLVGQVEYQPEEDQAFLPEEFSDLKILLQHILEQIKTPFSEPQKIDDAAWVAGRLIEWLPLDLDHKQKLLEMNDPLSRLFCLRDEMQGLDVL